MPAVKEKTVFVRLRRVSQASQLSDDKLDDLKFACERLLPRMHGKTLLECVDIVREQIGCNADQLAGLPKRFHVWEMKVQ